MAQRTPLGVISNNVRPKNHELTPSQRGQIIGALQNGATYAGAATQVDYNEKTARSTLKRYLVQPTNVSHKRSGRPSKWDERFERRLLRFIRINPKSIYAQVKRALDYTLSHDTIARILKPHGIKNWMCKKRLYLSEEVARKRLQFALAHID